MRRPKLPPREMAFRFERFSTCSSVWRCTNHVLRRWIITEDARGTGDVPLHLYVYNFMLTLPPNAKRLYAVATNTPRRPAHSFRLTRDGGVLGFNETPCSVWQEFLTGLYARGYRWVQFQYEE
jgi:hypothetical protein